MTRTTVPPVAPLVFHKMTGSGNDFVFVDGRLSAPATWTPERIAALCDRRRGIGADGLVVLEPDAGRQAVRMHYWHADGSRAAMCGNAALCSVRLSARLGLASAGGMLLLTDAGEVPGRCLGDGHEAEIEMPPVGFSALVPGIGPAHGEHWVRFIKVGVPHLVVLVDDVEGVDLMKRGAALRHHPALGPEGANVNFVSRSGATNPWRIRTFERGVEGETLACGTGTIGSGVTLAQLGLDTSPVPFLSTGGGALTVRAHLEGGEAHQLWLRGEGRLVFEATVTP